MAGSDRILAALQAHQVGQAPTSFSNSWASLPTAMSVQQSAPSLGSAPTLGAAVAASMSAGNEAATSSSSRAQRMREEKARKEEEQKEGERLRCHLHKKLNNKCKACQRYKEFVDKGKEEKAALLSKFQQVLRRDTQRSGGDEDRRKVDLVNTKTYGFPPLLQSHIVESAHFKTVMAMETFEQVVDELFQYADGVEPYAMANLQAPSCLFVCVYRLFAMGLEVVQLRQLLENNDSPFVRCAGVLYVRYGLAAEQLWPWLGEYVLDQEEFPPGQEYEWGSTVGECVEMLMSQDSYYKTVLPRLPVTVKRQLENKLSQVSQYRKRAQANQEILDTFRGKSVRVEACPTDSDWLPGEVLQLIEEPSSRMKLRIRFDADPREQNVHIGKVILAASAGTSASRGGNVVDWTRDKGRSHDELLEEYRTRTRERAVVSSGKEYSRRPVSFQVAMPLDQGNASYSLTRDETYVARSKGRDRSRSRSPLLSDRRKEPSAEHQAKMKALFEKYGMQKSVESTRQNNDLDRPDVMRLG
jgi:pre-mRNA-splicing factor 38B